MSNDPTDAFYEDPDGEIVAYFPQAEMVVMLARIANSIAQLTAATRALADGNREVAIPSIERAGQAVDKVMATFAEFIEKNDVDDR